MKPVKKLATLLATITLLGSSTTLFAEGLTREQVKAELAEARRNGTLIANTETMQTYRDLYPDRYPPAPTVIGKTREQVKAELAEARRNGTLIANAETMQTFRDLYPDRYPPAPTVIGKTREQVKAELAEAILLGDTPLDEYGRTPAERFPSAYASVRAAHAMKARSQVSDQTTKASDDVSLAR